MKIKQPRGMLAFTIVWIGQVISLMGSAMTGFALTIWAWRVTNSATALAIVGICNFAPTIIFSPIAGALVDRWNRKLVMMLSDLATGMVTIGILILSMLDALQIWHLYVGGVIAGTFQAFQWPAYSAAISMMIPKENYSRAAGMMSLAEWGSGVFSPVLAGALLGAFEPNGLQVVLVIDIITFTLAIGALLWIFIPQPQSSPKSIHEPKPSLWQDSLFGFRYILDRPSLLNLQLIFTTGNLLSSIAGTLISPMILARTGDNALTLGSVQTAGSIGGIAGSLLISTLGSPKKKIHGVLLGWAMGGLLGTAVLGFGQSLIFWLIGSFFASFFGPVINSSNQTIWQLKVSPDKQGRVFSIRRMIAQISAPLGMVVAGALADNIFEPMVANADPTPMSRMIMQVFGSVQGSGMAFLITTAGLLMVLIGLAAYLNPSVRNVETLLPDHDQISQSEAVTAD